MTLATRMDACSTYLVLPFRKLVIQLHRMNPAPTPAGDLELSKLSLINPPTSDLYRTRRVLGGTGVDVM